jgi:hypothetical protein
MSTGYRIQLTCHASCALLFELRTGHANGKPNITNFHLQSFAWLLREAIERPIDEMTTQYFLPAVGSRSTSPPARVADSTSSSESHATFRSHFLPQLPSSKNLGRLSIGSNSSKTERLPLASIDTNESKKLHQPDTYVASKLSDSNVIADSVEPMQLDDAPSQMVQTQSVEKTMDLVYPSNAKLPSRSLVQALFDEAMKMVADSDDAIGDQKDLCDAGLLSLEQVLLPAVAYQEEQMLKEWQSFVQRDGSAQQKANVIALRKAVYSGIGAACAAVQQSRHERAHSDHARERQWKLEFEQRQAEILQERQKQEALLRQQRQEAMIMRKCDLQKKLPANQDVWREVAYLMTELTKLSNEEQQWRNVAAQYLDRTEALLIEQENLYESQPKQEAMQPQDGVATTSVQQAVSYATDTALDIALAVDRIRNALRQISQTASWGEQSRQQLYHQYVTHHQFYGYQGIHDPKGLLKVLSQSQQNE